MIQRSILKYAVLALWLCLLTINCSNQNRKIKNLLLYQSPLIGQNCTDTLFTALKDYPAGANLSFVFIKDSLTVFYGVRVSESGLETVENPQSIYEIGSITKLFTSLLFMDAVRRGEVQEQEPVSAFFPFPLKAAEKNGVPITLRHLSNHTSGLPRVAGSSIKPMLEFITSFEYNPYKNFDRAALESYLKDEMELDTVPGTVESYSNLGASLLGEALVRRTGKSYEALLQERMFQPLGMSHSTTNRAEVQEKLVKGINLFGTEATNWDMASAAPAGGVLSNAEDLSRFMKAVIHLESSSLKPVIEASVRETFRTSEREAVGYGWQIANRKSGEPIYWHNGATGGYTSALAINPGRNSGVVILSNVNPIAGESLTPLCFKLLRVIEAGNEGQATP